MSALGLALLCFFFLGIAFLDNKKPWGTSGQNLCNLIYSPKLLYPFLKVSCMVYMPIDLTQTNWTNQAY